MTTTIGFIGSGNIGGTVARLATEAGYDVILSNSRGPETLVDQVGELGDRARAGTTEEAAAADVVVVSVPLFAYRDVPAPRPGTVVLDTMNYYPDRDGTIDGLEDGSATTSGLLQEQLPQAKVVKAFNNIFVKNLASMARPGGAEDRTALPIAGDDETARRTAAGFLDRIGYDAYDAGPLADSWRFERDTPAYVTPYFADGDPTHERPVSGETLAGLLAEAHR